MRCPVSLFTNCKCPAKSCAAACFQLCQQLTLLDHADAYAYRTHQWVVLVLSTIFLVHTSAIPHRKGCTVCLLANRMQRQRDVLLCSLGSKGIHHYHAVEEGVVHQKHLHHASETVPHSQQLEMANHALSFITCFNATDGIAYINTYYHRQMRYYDTSHPVNRKRGHKVQHLSMPFWYRDIVIWLKWFWNGDVQCA